MLIADPWQRQGLGTTLLRQLLEIGREEGLERICAEILQENRAMQQICRKLGFRLQAPGRGRPGGDQPDGCSSTAAGSRAVRFHPTMQLPGPLQIHPGDAESQPAGPPAAAPGWSGNGAAHAGSPRPFRPRRPGAPAHSSSSGSPIHLPPHPGKDGAIWPGPAPSDAGDRDAVEPVASCRTSGAIRSWLVTSPGLIDVIPDLRGRSSQREQP